MKTSHPLKIPHDRCVITWEQKERKKEKKEKRQGGAGVGGLTYGVVCTSRFGVGQESS